MSWLRRSWWRCGPFRLLGAQSARWPQGMDDCEGEIAVVVASDEAAQSDVTARSRWPARSSRASSTPEHAALSPRAVSLRCSTALRLESMWSGVWPRFRTEARRSHGSSRLGSGPATARAVGSLEIATGSTPTFVAVSAGKPADSLPVHDRSGVSLHVRSSCCGEIACWGAGRRQAGLRRRASLSRSPLAYGMPAGCAPAARSPAGATTASVRRRGHRDVHHGGLTGTTRCAPTAR